MSKRTSTVEAAAPLPEIASVALPRPAALRYVGAGASLLDVPARDLTETDLAPLSDSDVASLIACGLYAAAEE